MSRYRVRNQYHLYFITFRTVGWIDVFSRQRYRDLLIESFKFCQANKGLLIYAYVIMTNHVHMVVSAEEGFQLSNILRDMKKFTARQILNSIQNESGEWVEESPWDINTYVKDKHQSTFHYNSNGLLEKIIQTTNEGSCEYHVYHYTK